MILSLIFAALLGAQENTNIVIYSDVKMENAWERKVVMQDAEGDFFNDDDQVGDLASVTAADEAATNSQKIAVAAKTSMTNEIARLDAAKVNAATNAIGVALVFTPETSRTNLTMFVVLEDTDGYTDTQYVWVNKTIDVEPNRYVVYDGYGHCATQKVTWVNWSTVTNITVNGRTWNGCHKCTVIRPSFAQNLPCLTNPNESRFGGVHGFDFGDLILTMGGIDQPLDTCVLTNKFDSTEIIYFNNGFFMGYYTGE